MPTVILRMPKAAVSMQTGIIGKWLVDDGVTVTEGQLIYELEIEKAMVEIESPASGILRQNAAAGEDFAVGEIIGEVNQQFAHPARIERDRCLVVAVNNPVVRQELQWCSRPSGPLC